MSSKPAQANYDKLSAQIKQSPLLDSLPDDVIQEQLANGSFTIENYNKDSVVYLEGESCDALKVILSGSLAVDRIEESGDFLTVSAFDCGCGIGGNLIFLDNPRFPLTVSARENSVLLSIDRESLFALLSQYPDFLRKYLRFTGSHAFILGDKIKLYKKRSIRENMLDFLESERQRQKSNRVELKLTKKALAEQLGVRRSSLSRELNKMRADGLIDFDARSITILQ